MTTQEQRKNLKMAKLDGCVQQAENTTYGTGGPSFVLSLMDSLWLHHFGVCVTRNVWLTTVDLFFFPEEKQVLLGAIALIYS